MRAWWILVIVAMLGPAANCWTEGLPRTKKLLEYGWDVPYPTYVRDNIREMEKRPFDGVIMRLAGEGRGNIFMGGRWDEADFAEDFAALAAIDWGERFTDNFIMIYAASEMDWFSDEDWDNVLANVRIMTHAARLGRCHLAFDAEPYGKNPWSYEGQVHAGEKSFEEYSEIIRQRGRQFMQAIQADLPDTVVHTLFSYSYLAHIAQEPNLQNRKEQLKQHSYGLYVAFLNGMLDVMGPGVVITDGNEASYYYTSSEDFYRAYHTMRQGVLPLIPRENVDTFLLQTQAAQALYMDYVFKRVPWGGIPAQFLSHDEQVKWFEHNTYWALKTTDEYVWLYSEKMNWWTGRDIPEGMEEAMVRAREDIREGRPCGVDLKQVMQEMQARLQREIDENLIRRQAEIPRLAAAPPVIDGSLDDAAWQQAAALEPFVRYFGVEEEVTGQTEAFVTYDADNLYIAMRCHEPNIAGMQIVGETRDSAVWEGDSVDLFITTAPEGVPNYHFILNPHNVQWDAFFDHSSDMSYNPEWESAVSIGETQWIVEMRVPWAELSIEPAAGLRLRANMCRQRTGGRETSSWSQALRGFMEAEHFGTWVLKE